MAYFSLVTRFAPIRKVFVEGTSELLTQTATLSVLYEDLRIEISALFVDDDQLKILDSLDKRYRILYFLRRSTVTLFEFHGTLTRLTRTPEFKAL